MHYTLFACNCYNLPFRRIKKDWERKCLSPLRTQRSRIFHLFLSRPITALNTGRVSLTNTGLYDNLESKILLEGDHSTRRHQPPGGDAEQIFIVAGHNLKNPGIFSLIYYHSWQYPRIKLVSPNHQIYITKWAIIRFLHKYWLYSFRAISNFRLIFLSDAKYIFVKIILKLNYDRVLFLFGCNSLIVWNCRKC